MNLWTSLSIAVFLLGTPLGAATVTTVIGTGEPGLSDTQVANPYGVIIGPDGALYFCDLDNQRIRRIDPSTGRTTTIAGNGSIGYSGDGGPATQAALNMPHEIQFHSINSKTFEGFHDGGRHVLTHCRDAVVQSHSDCKFLHNF